MPIKVLDPRVVSQIAAGEVVERPASVVKELVENALDASATEIAVEARGGGTDLIRVIDNGLGIPADQVELAFQRHATSKVSSLDDLEHIESLGFRGEALPSIAAVAEVEMVTRSADGANGAWVRLDGGGVVERGSRGRSRGTTLTVRHLFRRVPARLKFLKSPATENSHMAAVVSQYALAYPGVKFALLIDGKTTLRTPGSGNLIDSLIEVYGLEIARGVIPLGGYNNWAGGKSEIRVGGMVGVPSLSRNNRNYLSFFVNRRWVSSRLLAWAVEEAYHGLLMTGKHPVAVIDITLPPNGVDVNIHPAKSEVKFRDERAVFIAVQKAVRQALVSATPVPRMEEVAVRYGAPPAQHKPAARSPWEDVTRQPDTPSPPAQIPLLTLPVLRVLGQLETSYIIAEGPDGLYIIDQHAAHERIRFEEIRKQRECQGVVVQGLLEPVPFEVSPRQEAVMKSHYHELANFGFSLEPFGGRTYLVRAVPAVLSDRDWRGVLVEMLDGAIGGNWTERLMVSLACHSAVRAGQVLSESEMRELVAKLAETALPHTCPHGRPTMIHISAERLKKDFGRS
jgi:DNA mismatch repair protein MutL